MKRKPLTYSLLDQMFASADTPMPAANQRYTMMGYIEALAAIKTDAAPTEDHWRVLSDAVNLCESLVELGEANDDDRLIADAVAAMAGAAGRCLAGGNLRFDGPGVKSMTYLIEDLGEAVATLPHRTMILAHRHAEKRMREIIAGKRKPGDVVVCL